MTLLSIASFGLPAAEPRPAEVTVVVSGRADVSSADYRSLALADALRTAVQQGAGINLISETKVSDFQLDYDRFSLPHLAMCAGLSNHPRRSKIR